MIYCHISNIYIKKTQGKLLLVFQERFFFINDRKDNRKKREGRKGHGRKKLGRVIMYHLSETVKRSITIH